MKLLLVNSEQEFIDNFIYSFKSEDYEISLAKNIKDAIDLVSKYSYDLAIIDMKYRDGTGLDLKRKMNEIAKIPTIVVSYNKDPNNVVLALEYGCDDYIQRPFYLLELKARIRAVIRRAKNNKIIRKKNFAQENNKKFVKEKFEFDVLGRKVKVGNVEMDLTGKEFNLLYILVSNKNKIFSRRDLANELWKGIDESNIRTVDVHIRRLREKLKATNTDKYIQTSWGEGYYYDDEIKKY